MNWKPTVALLACCLGLGAWVYWDIQQEAGPGQDAGVLLPDLNVSAVTKIEIDRPVIGDTGGASREHIVFERSEEHWVLSRPRKGQANTGLVTAILEFAVTHWSANSLSVMDGLAKYGLGDEAIRVSYLYPGGSVVLLIGKETEYEKMRYAMVEGEKRIRMMDNGFAGPYTRPLQAYAK